MGQRLLWINSWNFIRVEISLYIMKYVRICELKAKMWPIWCLTKMQPVGSNWVLEKSKRERQNFSEFSFVLNAISHHLFVCMMIFSSCLPRRGCFLSSFAKLHLLGDCKISSLTRAPPTIVHKVNWMHTRIYAKLFENTNNRYVGLVDLCMCVKHHLWLDRRKNVKNGCMNKTTSAHTHTSWPGNCMQHNFNEMMLMAYKIISKWIENHAKELIISFSFFAWMRWARVCIFQNQKRFAWAFVACISCFHSH